MKQTIYSWNCDRCSTNVNRTEDCLPNGWETAQTVFGGKSYVLHLCNTCAAKFGEFIGYKPDKPLVPRGV